VVSQTERAVQYDFPSHTLAGKVVLLAGGSGGLGAATAALLARERASLILGFRSNHSRAESLRNALATFGSRIELVAGDLTHPGVPEQYVHRAAALGPLSAVAIFAGDPARPEIGEAESVTREMERMELSWKVNFHGPYHLARLAAQRMAEQATAGSIVLVTTMQAVVPFPRSAVYSAPKAALTHAARVLAHEFGGKANISVNVVAPGVTEAGMAAASVSSGKYERFLRDGVIPRYGRAEDVARVVRLLLEPDGYITGQVITVDGGLTLRR
jgi:NAD(P)-dependent dehydrogenase (short-subunit alcohol dehydrogenase family)